MGALSSINILFKVNLDQFSTEMQKATREIKKTSGSLKSIGSNLSTYVTLPALAAGAASIKFASDYEESLNKVNVAFGDSTDYVQDWAKSSLDSFGIAEGSALDMASLFGDMATSMGLPQKEAAKMSTSLVGLAGDLASFKNIGIAEATTALNGIFTGETESLKRLGVVMTEANLKTFAYSQGITKQIKDMTEAEKVNLRYAFVLSKTKNAQGDFERTGGGAANQMRVFTESLKQVGQQLGAVILPIFTKVITFVNEKIKAFSNLSDTSKVLIVSIVGIAAAIGPLLSGLGSVLGFVPALISKFNSLRESWSSFTALLAANPIASLAVGVGLVVAGIIAYSNSVNGAVDVTELFNEVTENAAKSIAKEKAELDTLLAISKNETLSKKERESAIKKLNAISPQYLGSLSLETINTDKTTEAVKRYNVALEEKAIQQAVLSKKTELYQKKIELLNKDLSFSGNAFSDSAQKASNYIFSLLGVETATIRNISELNKYIKSQKLNKEQADAVRSSYKSLIAERNSDAKSIDDQLKALDGLLLTNKSLNNSNEELAGSSNNVANALGGIGKATSEIVKPGTVAFFEQLKSKLEEQQKTIPTTNAAWLSYENRIEAVKKKIENLTNVKQPGTIAFYEAQISDLKKFQSELSKTSREFLVYQQDIDKIQSKIDQISVAPLVPITQKFTLQVDNESGLKKIVETAEIVGQTGEKVKASWQVMQENGQAFSEGMASIFESVTESFVTGFAEMLGNSLAGGLNIQSIWNLMLGTLADAAIQVGKLAIGIGISVEGIKKALSSLSGPVAVAAGIALVALGTFAKSALSDIGGGGNVPAFANGGIVGGSSYYGDKILARINSGEMILNQKQQANLYGMMGSDSSESQPIVLNGGFKLSGSDIELVIDRAIKKNNRKR